MTLISSRGLCPEACSVDGVPSEVAAGPLPHGDEPMGRASSPRARHVGARIRFMRPDVRLRTSVNMKVGTSSSARLLITWYMPKEVIVSIRKQKFHFIDM